MYYLALFLSFIFFNFSVLKFVDFDCAGSSLLHGLSLEGAASTGSSCVVVLGVSFAVFSLVEHGP